jgi:branched-chain amino acid transport system ATP-binding protein
LLTVENVSSGYGKLQIITNVSIKAEPKQITVIVGPNGSGKSTLLKTIAGLVPLYGGKIMIESLDVSGLPPHIIARKGLAYLPQRDSVFLNLTVTENILLGGYTSSKTEVEFRMFEALKLFPSVNQYMNSKVQDLSGGERQMVAMIMALVRKPSVIMLDEPTANLSPKLASQVLESVEKLARQVGITVVLVEQNARKALEIGDYAYLLVSGKKAFEGTPRALLTHPELSKLYLGLEANS